MAGYDFLKIEKKWQEYWDKNQSFKTEVDYNKPKYYILDMFPYPSGAGLHVGHPEGYTATDILSRYKRMCGFNVMHPMGWDAFGLPAENYAIQTKTHPKETTEKNIRIFKQQIKALGFSYDWKREINTTDPNYYKWTQWIFIQLYKKGLAYEKEMAVNWCGKCKAVLANEEVKDGTCERCGSTAGKKILRQWMLKITKYAQRLLDDLEALDWPEAIKEMQRNWIGRSEGAKVQFRVEGVEEPLTVYTTRPDTLFGATYMVLAPEHPLTQKITKPQYQKEMDQYVHEAGQKNDLDRTELAIEKTGVFTGSVAVNPMNNKKIPIWVADYVMMGYGTGAIMAVPAHDQRDYEFAKKFGMEILQVIEGGDISKAAWEGNGNHINSEFINGLNVPDAIAKITHWLGEKNLGKSAVNYKLRDWVFSRQRYWGEPFPIVHFDDGTQKILGTETLPIILPQVENYEPSGTGESPLSVIEDWINTHEKGKAAKRESNTMPQWAGSCWYYLRFLDPHNSETFCAPDIEKYWMPVDLYVGGAEHAVLHLLYARFWHKVLYDIGAVSTKEPFTKLVNQGLILGEDGEKMSKSRGNTINPNDVIEKYGADSLRLYYMFMGPLEKVKPWNTKGIEGLFRFIKKIWRMIVTEEGKLNPNIKDEKPNEETLNWMHKTTARVTEDCESIRLNTAIAGLMEYRNHLGGITVLPKKSIELLVQLLSPFAPHVCEELWEKLGHSECVAYQAWPKHDPSQIKSDSVTFIVQVNGKVRDRIEMPINSEETLVKEKAMESENVQKHLSGKKVFKAIFVPNKLLSLVVK